MKENSFVFRENFQNHKYNKKLQELKSKLNISNLSTTSETPLAHSNLRKALNPNNTGISFKVKT